MNDKASAAESAFEQLLRSFQGGALSHDEMMHEVARLMANGASPARLSDILRRRELVERLPESVRAELAQRLRSVAPEDLDGSAEPPTVILDDVGRGEGEDAGAAEAGKRITVGGILIRRFRLVELIGTGGMSRVYKAVDLASPLQPPSGDFVAIKVLNRPADTALNALPLVRLNHPNIVRVFGSERDGDVVFLIMELLEGTSLYRRIAARRLDPTEARSIIMAVASALEHAHRHGVVHGDLKPGNVIVSEGGVKVIDFGMVDWINRTGSSQRSVTPCYASPQLMKRLAPEIADDVYALACLAYELLTEVQGAAASSAKFSPPRLPPLTLVEHSAIVHGVEAERANRTPSIAQFMAEFTAASAPAASISPKRSRPWVKWTAAAASLAALIALGFAWFQGSFLERRPFPAPTVATNQAQPALSTAQEDLGAAAPAGTVPQPGSHIRDCATCPLMAVLPAGRFNQDTASVASPAAQHEDVVTIQHPFALTTTDITVREFAEFAAATQRDFRGCDTYDGSWHHRSAASWNDPGFEQSPNHPVTCTSWNDAIAYAQWLSTKTAHRYRLPSAAEWEYAARGGTAAAPWDKTGAGACSQANVADQSAAQRYPGWTVFACDDHFVYTAPVGSFKANAFGLYDMLGNVFQWTEDCWYADHHAPEVAASQDEVPCTDHELRGGSWFSAPAFVRASFRNHFAADYRGSSVGFRIARDLTP